MKKILTIILCLAIAATGCKKKEEPKKKNNSGTTTTTGGSTTGGTGTPTNATTYSGIFTTTDGVASLAGFTLSATDANVWFSSSPQATINPQTTVTVDSVLFNGTPLEIDSIFYSTNQEVDLTAETWVVGSTSVIPSFTFENTQARPTMVLPSQLPTKITKASGLTINLGNLSNFTSGSLIITDDSGNITGTIIKPLVPGNNNFTFSSQELAGLQAGEASGSVIVILQNHQVINFGGKNFRFNKVMQGGVIFIDIE